MSPRSPAAERGDLMPVAVVTGGTGGIGRACVERLHADGYEVVSVDVAPPAEAQPARHVTADLRDAETAVEAIRAACPSVDVLVNGAGVVEPLPFATVGLADWERVVAVNARAPFFLMQGLVDRMPRGAAIIGIASIEAVTVLAMSGATSSIYASTKAALRSLTETLAVELGPRGIRVNAVAPGLIRTPMTARAQVDERDAWIRSHTPLGRWGEPGDIADVVGFLASPAARFMTGTTLVVDGGISLGQIRGWDAPA
jgi:NAD(P)-dependent dehydrogenase (short-subunit alcohol dehydrogenase family)